MKLHYLVASLVAAALAAPAIAQDNSAQASETASTKAEQKKPTPHNHVADRYGMLPAQASADPAQPAKQPAHDHGRIHKQQ